MFSSEIYCHGYSHLLVYSLRNTLICKEKSVFLIRERSKQEAFLPHPKTRFRKLVKNNVNRRFFLLILAKIRKILGQMTPKAIITVLLFLLESTGGQTVSYFHMN